MLPIVEIRDALLAAAREHRRLIITAPTGSGKSTQIPQYLLDSGLPGQIVILQPRRLPARLLASWVAQARGGKLGDEVGYQIRFEDCTSARTRIRYVTEGVLLRQMLTDPGLTGVSCVIFDEFHERHLYSDITLARARQIQETSRPDLLLVVMSATLETSSVERYLQPCQVLESRGRSFPVEIQYLNKPLGDTPLWDAVAEILDRPFEGDALVFMPGAYEIQRTIQAIRDRHGNRWVVLPLHGELPAPEQDAAVARYDKPKVIVATNVAETSLTIDGIRLVIDSGLARIPRYDPHRGINTLLIDKISRASADQRAGRAGRTAPGRCIRLWTLREHESRPLQELPEVKRLDLSEVILTLKAAGVSEISAFPWFEAPDAKVLQRAEQLLRDLGATGAAGRITPLGRRMVAFPLHPRYSRMMLAAADCGCVRPVALIAALTQGRSLLTRSESRQSRERRDELFAGETASDLFVLMRAWRYADRYRYDVSRCRQLGIHAQTARQVRPLYEQFLSIAEREGLDVSEKPVTNEAIQKCVLAGFSDHLARRLDAGTLRCAMVHGRRGVRARESVVEAPLFVATEVAEIEGREINVLLNLCTAVEETWLRELFPEDFEESVLVRLDASRRVVAIQQRRFRDLILTETVSGTVSPDAAARLLAEEVLAGRLTLNEWGDAVEQWITRVNRLSEWMPELGLPRIEDADRAELVRQICHGALSYKEIKDKPVLPAVRAWLSAEQQGWVEQYAPERVELKSGRRAKITYTADGPPTLAARIQDLYGTTGLRIAAGRVPVRITVLAPNHRPVQVTDDLTVFWRETYPQLKAELQRKYPKHEWR